MFREIRLSGTLVFAALSLMQGSAFAAERNDHLGGDERRGVVQDNRGGYAGDDHRYDRGRYSAGFRDDRDHRNSRAFEWRFGFRPDDDRDRDWR